MRIVHIGNVPLPSDHPDFGQIFSHPGRWVLNHAIAQRQYAGIQPTVVVQVPGARRNHIAEWDGIEVHYIAAPDRLRAATLFWFDVQRIDRYVSQFNADVVHAHGTEDAYGLAAQRSGLPYVITAQGLFFLINRVLRPKFISRQKIVQFTEHLCLQRAKCVIAKSDYVADALRLEFPHLALHRIPNTVDLRLGEIEEARDSRVFAFVGVIDHRKGLDLIAAAVAKVQTQFPDIKLWVFGDNPDAKSPYEIAIKRELADLMGDNVVFHGVLPGYEVARRVARSTALVAPSREEMFGNQVVESLATGTFAIVTEHTAMAENVRRFGNGAIVPQENVDNLAESMRSVLQRSPDKSIAEGSRKRVLEEFSPSNVAAQHLALYENLRD